MVICDRDCHCCSRWVGGTARLLCLVVGVFLAWEDGEVFGPFSLFPTQYDIFPSGKYITHIGRCG